jgi:hypothetical protein
MRVRETPKTPKATTKTMGHKSSIHVNVVQSNSESHNKREEKLDYVYEDLSKNNESWEQSKISDRLQEIKELCLEKSGRKLQKNAEPIREAVVNIKSTTTMNDLKRLTDRLKTELKIEAIQIHIHRDEGKSRTELNHHAHIVFDWQDKEKGTTIKFNKQGLSEMQNIVSEVLDMERGVTSDKKHLKSLQFKNQQEALKLSILIDKTTEQSTRLDKLLEDKNNVINNLGAIKEEERKELEKLRNLQGQNEKIENNAKGYISSNWLGVVDKEKTTENIAKLISNNSELESTNSKFLKINIELKDRNFELMRDVNTLKSELNKFKDIASKAILQPKYGRNYNEEFIQKLRLDKEFDNLYTQNERKYKELDKPKDVKQDVKKDQNMDRGMSR